MLIIGNLRVEPQRRVWGTPFAREPLSDGSVDPGGLSIWIQKDERAFAFLWAVLTRSIEPFVALAGVPELAGEKARECRPLDENKASR